MKIPIDPKREQSVETPEYDYGKVGDLWQTMGDLSNVVIRVPDFSKDVQGHCQRIASIVCVIRHAQSNKLKMQNMTIMSIMKR